MNKINRFIQNNKIIVFIAVFAIVGLSFAIVGTVFAYNTYNAYNESKDGEHISAQVIALDIVDDYIEAVVEYTYNDEVYQHNLQENSLYQGENLTLAVIDEDPTNVNLFYDSLFSYDKFILGICFIAGGIVFCLIAYFVFRLIKKEDNPSDASANKNALPKIFIIVSCAIISIGVILTAIFGVMQSNYNPDDYESTVATYIAVPEYTEEVTKEADGTYDVDYVFHGDTVVEYDVDGVVYRAKVKDDTRHFLDEVEEVYYKAESPGKVYESINSNMAGIIAGVAMILFGALFLFIGIKIKKHDNKQTATINPIV